MTAELVERLRAGLEGTTKGEWFEGHRWVFVSPVDAERNPIKALRSILRDVPDGEIQRNCAHIANCSPDNIRTLLDTIDGLRARLAEVEGETERLTTADKDWGRLHQQVIEERAAEIRARESAEQLVERAFRDGVTYGTNVEVVDVDLAWETSAVRSILKERNGG